MTPSHQILDGAASLSPDKLEQEIGKLIPRPATRNVPPVKLAPMPDYVEHRGRVSQIGSLSAEAIVREYEAAAKEIEAMGAALIEAARKCEAMTADVQKAIVFVQETATCYREGARKTITRIEEYALLSEQVRETCEKMRNKISGVPVAYEDDAPKWRSRLVPGSIAER